MTNPHQVLGPHESLHQVGSILFDFETKSSIYDKISAESYSFTSKMRRVNVELMYIASLLLSIYDMLVIREGIDRFNEVIDNCTQLLYKRINFFTFDEHVSFALKLGDVSFLSWSKPDCRYL